MRSSSRWVGTEGGGRVAGRLGIICVDDERMVLSGLRDQLRRAFGEEVLLETAESGEEGLEVLEELVADGETVALEISDQLMPGMRGEAFLAEVHRLDPRILTVLLTGQASADAVGAAVNQARLYRYIAKPWDEPDLVLTVRQALRSHTQAREIARQEEEARLAHQASLRFVPREFLALLGRERLVDVRFGDHVVRPMHVFFSDMRGFTSIVEKKSSAEAFAFINDYLQRMQAEILRFGGFIVEVEGDAILALFSGTAAQAVQAGVANHRALDRLNAERAARSEPPVQMGVGVNSGPLLLGTVGSEERLKCGVVGDPVNLAARVESLTKSYGARMMISDATEGLLGDGLELRLVDRVRVKGKVQPVSLYEVLDAWPEPQRSRRIGTRADFQAGVQHLRVGEPGAALACFRAVMGRDPEDRAAVLLAARCQGYQQGGLPADWDGVVRLQHK